MPWYRIAKVLHIKRTLEARREEPAKGSHERSKDSHDYGMQLEGRVRDASDVEGGLRAFHVSETLVE